MTPQPTPETTLTPEERERVMLAVTRRIHKYRLETPAAFFLELNRPLAGIAGLASHMVTPLFGAFMGLENAERYAALIGDKSALDELLNRLEKGAGYRVPGVGGAETEKPSSSPPPGPTPDTRHP